MKCRKCKQLKTIEEKVVHMRETHGFLWDYLPSDVKEKVNWEKVEALWNDHKKTGLVSKDRFAIR